MAYYIVLEREIPGFDHFVNGKSIARESDRLGKVTETLGLRDINEFVSASPDELAISAEDLGIELPDELPPEAWFAPEEGLSWVSQVENHLRSNPSAVDNADKVLADLHEYRDVFTTAQANSVRWHFAVDF